MKAILLPLTPGEIAQSEDLFEESRRRRGDGYDEWHAALTVWEQHLLLEALAVRLGPSAPLTGQRAEDYARMLIESRPKPSDAVEH